MKWFLNVKIFAGLIILLLMNFSCKKDKPYMSNAEIIGIDAKMCPCCGGPEIIIDNVPIPNGNTYFLVGDFPSGFTFGDNPKFPIAVRVDWKIDSLHCFGSYVDIIKITRR